MSAIPNIPRFFMRSSPDDLVRLAIAVPSPSRYHRCHRIAAAYHRTGVSASGRDKQVSG
jgi:hypothetical protein